MLPIFGSLLGIVVLAFTIVDVLATVFGSNGRSIFSALIYRISWTILRLIGRFLPGPVRQIYLSTGATLMVTMLVVLWITSLIFGFALMYAGGLVGDLDFGSSNTTTDLGSSLRLSLVALSTIGFVEIGPSDKDYSALIAIQAITGAFILTMAITYFIGLQYVVQNRRAFGARLAAWNEANGTPDNAALEESLAATLEGLRSYPVTYYVRPPTFEESLPWTLLMLSEMTAPGTAGRDFDATRRLVGQLLAHLDTCPPGLPATEGPPLEVESFHALRHGLLPAGDTMAERFLSEHGRSGEDDSCDLYDRYRAWYAHVAPIEAVADRVARDLGYGNEWTYRTGRVLVSVSAPPRLGADPLQVHAPATRGP